MSKKRIYIIGRCALDGALKIDKFLRKINCFNYSIFRPTLGDVKDKEVYVSEDAYYIRAADEIWAVGDLGRDCQWELGYATGLGKTIKWFKDDPHICEDEWMWRESLRLGNLTIVYYNDDTLVEELPL